MKEYICVESPNEVDGGMLVRVQELIRCKDCRFCGDEPYEGTHVYICNRTMWSRSEGQRTAKGFCAWAEPKETK